MIGGLPVKWITEISWDRVVNDTANLWQSIFWKRPGAGAGASALRDPRAGQGDGKRISLLASRTLAHVAWCLRITPEEASASHG